MTQLTKIVFANPRAGNALAAKLRTDVPILTDISQYDAAIAALPDNAHVIAVGGDGTAHLILNKLYEAGKVSKVKFSIVPMGTGNDLARGLQVVTSTLGDYLNPDITAYAEKTLPVWRLVRRSAVAEETHLFFNFIGIGIDGKVVGEAEHMRRYSNRMLTQTLYAVAGLRNMFYRLPQDTRIALDDHHIDNKAGIILSQTHSYGGGCRLDTAVNSFTGELNSFVVRSWFDLVKIILTRVIPGTVRYADGCINRAVITGNHLPIQMDGEALPIVADNVMLTVSRYEQSLTCLVPKDM